MLLVENTPEETVGSDTKLCEILEANKTEQNRPEVPPATCRLLASPGTRNPKSADD